VVGRELQLHDFKINGKQTPLIQPGKTARLVVGFKKKGKYPISAWCPAMPRPA
jgi:uncharacterized cupredoxin-like copper-binding protein